MIAEILFLLVSIPSVSVKLFHETSKGLHNGNPVVALPNQGLELKFFPQCTVPPVIWCAQDQTKNQKSRWTIVECRWGPLFHVGKDQSIIGRRTNEKRLNVLWCEGLSDKRVNDLGMRITSILITLEFISCQLELWPPTRRTQGSTVFPENPPRQQ